MTVKNKGGLVKKKEGRIEREREFLYVLLRARVGENIKENYANLFYIILNDNTL